MKKFLRLGFLLAAVPPAMAQTNVQIYGVVDQFIEHARTDAEHVTRMTDGGLAASRVGFRGTENLGGGAYASFTLEAGFNGDTGTGTLPGPGLAFTRLSKVALGGRWGAIEAGRMFTPLFNSVSRGDPFGFNTVYSPLSLISATDAQTGIAGYASRANNMVYYRSPQSFPATAHLAYSRGEAGADGTRSADLWGGSIGYGSESFYVSYAIQKTGNATVAAPLRDRPGSTYQALSAYFSATPQLRLYGNLIASDSGDHAIAGSRVMVVGASWTSGASELRAAASRRRVQDSPRGQTLWLLGYDYNLSKRTALYGRLLHLQNHGGSTATVEGMPIDAAGGNGTSLGVGVRHSF